MHKRCAECGRVMKDYCSVWECHNCAAEYSKRSKEVDTAYAQICVTNCVTPLLKTA